MGPRSWLRYHGLVADNWSGRRLGAQVGYLGTKPLELGSLVRAQRYIVRHSATVLLTATMAPSTIVITAVITQIE
jgi:hypothetical protein